MVHQKQGNFFKPAVKQAIPFSGATQTKIILGATVAALAVPAIAAGGAAVVASAVRAVAPSMARTVIAQAPKLVPTTIKGKLISGAVTSLIGAGLVEAPKETLTTILKAPKELFEFERGLVNLAVNPNLQSVERLVKESPLLTTATIGTLAFLGVKKLVPSLIGLKTAGALKDIAEVLEKEKTIDEEPPANPDKKRDKDKNAKEKDSSDIASNVPLSPATEVISVGGGTLTRRRRKLKKRKETPNLVVRNQNIQILGRCAY